MGGPQLGPGGEDITWPDQVAPRGRKASSTRKIKPQTSNLKPQTWSARCSGALLWACLSAATPAGAGGWGRLGARCAGQAASPPRPGVAVPSGGGRAPPQLLWLPSLGGGSRGGGEWV